MLIARFSAPVADREPDERAKHRDEYRAENCHVPVNEQIPGDDADEDAEAFNQRECRVRGQIHAQPVRVCRVLPGVRMIDSSWRGLAGAAGASETMHTRIDLTADIGNFFR